MFITYIRLNNLINHVNQIWRIWLIPGTVHYVLVDDKFSFAMKIFKVMCLFAQEVQANVMNKLNARQSDMQTSDVSILNVSKIWQSFQPHVNSCLPKLILCFYLLGHFIQRNPIQNANIRNDTVISANAESKYHAKQSQCIESNSDKNGIHIISQVHKCNLTSICCFSQSSRQQ